MGDHIRQMPSAWERLTVLLEEINPTFLDRPEFAALNEIELIRRRHRASYICSQKVVIKFLEYSQKMTSEEVWEFCDI